MSLDGKRIAEQSATIENGAGVIELSLDARSERELPQLSFTIVPDTRDSDLSVRRPMPERERPAEAGAGRPRGIESWFWLAFGLFVLAEGIVRIRLAQRNPPGDASSAQPA